MNQATLKINNLSSCHSTSGHLSEALPQIMEKVLFTKAFIEVVGL